MSVCLCVCISAVSYDRRHVRADPDETLQGDPGALLATQWIQCSCIECFLIGNLRVILCPTWRIDGGYWWSEPILNTVNFWDFENLCDHL